VVVETTQGLMRVLVTGAGGQLGHELVTEFGDHEVFPLDHQSLDVSDREAVLACFTSLIPDLVLHAAAWTNVDGCESDVDRAFAVNAWGTRNVAEAARRAGSHLVYFSTDYVFDGEKSTPYLEWDTPNPQGVYGRSKLAGEHEVAQNPDSTIVRISWVSGLHGSNMVKTILRLAGEHPTLSFVDDQRGHPTFAADAARIVRRLAVDRRPGLYHVTNQGVATWFEFARAVLEANGDDPERVRPIATADLQPARPARRPANSVLENRALRLGGVPLLPHYREPLNRLVHELNASEDRVDD
jgi:dTDP-4-dehydrorhamnose reductase